MLDGSAGIETLGILLRTLVKCRHADDKRDGKAVASEKSPSPGNAGAPASRVPLFDSFAVATLHQSVLIANQCHFSQMAETLRDCP